MLQRLMVAMALGGGVGLLAGCGAVAGAGGGTVGASTNLNGNWLLAGSLPSLGFIAVPAPSGLTATFDVIGSNAVGVFTVQFSCTTGFSATTGGVASGAIAADGNFTLQAPSSPSGNTFTVQGKVPATVGGSWTGTYAVTLTGCGTFSDPIAATALPALTGTFAGSTAINGSPSLPITVKTNLQQGGYETAAGSTVYSNAVLGGTLTITGSPCLTSGTTTGASFPSALEGNTVVTNFKMNDGSDLQMSGSITSTDSSTLKVSFITISPGTCNADSLTSATQLLKQ